MKFEYEMTRKDLKKQFLDRHKYFNLIYLILFSVVFFILGYDIIRYNFWIVMIGYLIGIVTLYLLLLGVNHLFTAIFLKWNDQKLSHAYGTFSCEVTKKGIKEKINGQKLEILWEEEPTIKVNQKRVSIEAKNKGFIMLFEAKKMDALQYKELQKQVSNYIK